MSNAERKDQLPPSKRLLLALKEAKSKLEAVERAKHEPIAIIGMGCRFPGGANSPAAFWDLMKNGVDAITEVPPDRWNIDTYYDPNINTPMKMYTRYGGFLKNVDQFDPQFFSISPREAVSMDPQQRLLLEVSWEALENAGQIPEQLLGSLTGVFVGVTINDYGSRLVRAGKLDTYFSSGNVLNAIAGRLSYVLGLQGPCMAVDTACSSSLVAVHLACQSLRNGECNQALAGGVNLILAPENTIALSKARMMSADGRCKTFDSSADGFVRGEGCGVIVLKRLSDAVAAGDNILALIRGSATNQDGASSGFTVPNRAAQQALIQQALTMAKLKPAEVNYVEAHGTGTSLGDPVEVKALAAVLGEDRSPDRPLMIGSVKTNIGHLESAAGIAGLMKVVLSLQHQQLPPHLHFNQPNPYIPWDELPVKVTTALTPWQTGERPRIAGVSSFGASGTNAHVVLEEAPTLALEPSRVHRPFHLLTLSAKTPEALTQLTQRYQDYLSTYPNSALGDICFTANTGRSHFTHRLGVVSGSTAELTNQLAAFTSGEETSGIIQGQVTTTESPKIAFLFTGQGSQSVGMARQLYDSQPTFRAVLDRCNEILLPYLNKPLLEVLYPPDGSSADVDQTAYTQPALFAVEYALAQVWLSWGVQPSVVMGHSVGEYVAACIAGVFSLEDGLKLIAHRARLMQALPPDGEMVSLLASPQQVKPLLQAHADKVAIAAINAPQSVVISGKKEVVRSLCQTLETQGIKHKALTVSHAFHSPLMEPMLAQFEQVARQINYSAPKLKLISNVTGKLASSEITTAEYWCRHVRQPVLFAQGMETLYQQGYRVLLEVGAKPILLGMGRQCWQSEEGVWLPSLRPGVSDWQQMLSTLSQLYVQGAAIDWQAVNSEYANRRLVLPTYPFQRQRFWVEESEAQHATHQPFSKNGTTKSAHALLGRQLRSAAKDVQFEAELSQNSTLFLPDHQIYQQVVLPGTAYLEIALAAGASALKTKQLILEDVSIQQALILQDEAKTVQCILSPAETSGYAFQIFSLSEHETEEIWTLHAAGKIRVAASESLDRIDLSALQAHYTETIAPETYYQKLRTQGLEFGKNFQGIQQIWRQEQAVLGRIELPDLLKPDASSYQLHPVLLDACFQIFGATFQDSDRQAVYLPVGVEQLQLYQNPGDRLWCQVQVPAVLNGNTQRLHADLTLFDDTGIVIAEVKGLAVQRATRQALLRSLQQDLGDWLYRIEWQPKPIATVEQSRSRNWLIMSDSEVAATRLAEQLEERGDRCIIAISGSEYECISETHYQFNPLEPTHFQRLLSDSLDAAHPTYQGIIHLWDSEVNAESELSIAQLEAAQAQSCGSLLHLLQALTSQKWEAQPQLWVITRGAQAVGETRSPLQIKHAALWGLGRVITSEHPDLQCVRLDLDPNANCDDLTDLIQELSASDREDQIAYRQGERHVARLVRYRPAASAQLLSLHEPFRIKISEYGTLENLTLAPLSRRTPEPNEVEIQVRAVGLNFRDVLNALGMLKAHTEAMGITSTDDLPFGGECAGVITAIGAQVTHLKVGDEVIAAQALGSLSSHVTLPAAFVVRKPKDLSFEAAATIPTAFLTAYYGLHHQAQLKAGERVLIHAAAGGVGQAAVQVAHHLGATVFGTASPTKWQHLQQMGVAQVFHSRTLDFAPQVLAATEGSGVEAVLNSLNGEFISKSIEALGTGGRFVEIGKIGIWSTEQMQQARPDVRYSPFDLLDISLAEPDAIAILLAELMTKFEQGTFQPLPHKVFAIGDVVNAFRYMAQAKHIGKVVISIPVIDEATQPTIRGDSTYLITGGLGALGLKVAEWFVAQGAKHLVLTGRSGMSESNKSAIATMQQSGAQIEVMTADVADPNSVKRLLESVQGSMPPLKGIIHAAGVLDDGMLLGQNWERFQRVLLPKVAGAWNLHYLTQEIPLDFFVCFSSIAAILGSPGQGNYAAANAFLDALAHHRQATGLSGLSLNWGGWSEAGMAAALHSRNQAKWAVQGVKMIEPAQGLQILGEVLHSSAAQIAILPVDWSKFLGQMPPEVRMPLLESFAASAEPGSAQQSEFLQQLEATPVSDRKTLLLTHIRSQIARVLGLGSPEQIGLQQGFADLGMDSLMAVELRNRLQTSLGCSMSASLVYDYPTVEALGDYLAQAVLSIDAAETFSDGVSETQTEEDDRSLSIQSNLDDLSDSEAEALLLSKLESMRY
jgi:acyl transferase domain-containing protein/acyl carrier protein